MKTEFQSGVDRWMRECFGEKIAKNTDERNHRFLEESLELVQSLGCSRDDAHMLVDYVFDRDTGIPAQEIGGVMVTLAALCSANGHDMDTCGDNELFRVFTKIEQIREKQKGKPSSKR